MITIAEKDFSRRLVINDSRENILRATPIDTKIVISYDQYSSRQYIYRISIIRDDGQILSYLDWCFPRCTHKRNKSINFYVYDEDCINDELKLCLHTLTLKLIPHMTFFSNKILEAYIYSTYWNDIYKLMKIGYHLYDITRSDHLDSYYDRRRVYQMCYTTHLKAFLRDMMTSGRWEQVSLVWRNK